MQHWVSPTLRRGIAALLVLCAATVFGCGPSPAPTLYIYCNETFWYVMQEEARAFNKIYGIRIVLIPLRVPDAAAETVEIDGNQDGPVAWRSMPGQSTVTQVTPRAQIHPEIERQIARISDESFGDLFLSDSTKHREKLNEEALSLSSGDFPVCYLTLTMFVPKGNPYQFHSVKEVLETKRRLGIVDPSRDGLGDSSWTVLGRIVPGGEPAIPMELVQLYERQYDLLEALEEKKIDAALVWNATSQVNFLLTKYASEYNTKNEKILNEISRQQNWQKLPLVLREMSETLVNEKRFAEEVPLTENPDEHFVMMVRLVALSSTSNFVYGKRFADFMRSNQGKEILRRFRFIPE